MGRCGKSFKGSEEDRKMRKSLQLPGDWLSDRDTVAEREGQAEGGHGWK